MSIVVKTVLHILNTGSYSGAENVVITLIRGFRERGSDIRFIYVSLDGSIREVLRKNDVEFEPIEAMKVGELKRVIKKYKPDFIHAHDFTASITAALAAGRIPVISHIHNNTPWIKKLNLKTIAYGLSCFKYYKMLGVSPSVFDEFIFGKFFRKKEVIVSNPVYTERTRRLAGEAEETTGYDVVALGRLTEQKDPLRFVEIIKKLSATHKISAVMIGDGELRGEIEAKIASDGLQDSITLAGFMENPYGILGNSRILCMTSVWEGYGLVAVEALALGKPVLATPVGGIPTILTEDGNEGKLCRSDEEFLGKLTELLDDESKYAEASAAARARADVLDNMDRYTAKLEEIYNK